MDSPAPFRRKSRGLNFSLLVLSVACLHERVPITASNLERLGRKLRCRHTQNTVKDLSALLSAGLLESTTPSDGQGGGGAICITSKGIASLTQWRPDYPDNIEEAFALYHLAFVVGLALGNGDVGHALRQTAQHVQFIRAHLKVLRTSTKLVRAFRETKGPAFYQSWLGIMSADLPAVADELELELSCRRAASLLKQREVLRRGGETPGMALAFDEVERIEQALETEATVSGPAPPVPPVARKRNRSRRTSPTAPIAGLPAPPMAGYRPPPPPSDDPPSDKKPN